MRNGRVGRLACLAIYGQLVLISLAPMRAAIPCRMKRAYYQRHIRKGTSCGLPSRGRAFGAFGAQGGNPTYTPAAPPAAWRHAIRPGAWGLSGSALPNSTCPLLSGGSVVEDEHRTVHTYEHACRCSGHTGLH